MLIVKRRDVPSDLLQQGEGGWSQEMHMQVIHERVAVSVTQCDLRENSQRGSDSGGRADVITTSLRYVAVNTSRDIVTFRTDFSESANIHLRFPSDRKCHPLNSTEKEKTSQPLVFVCTLHPFERLVLVYVLRRRKQRALVRVTYAVLSVTTPSFDAIVESQTRAATVIQQQKQSSSNTYSHLSKWEILPRLSATEVTRACEEINRHFREYGIVFVDASFPPSTTSLYKPETLEKLPESDASAYSLCTWEHLHTSVDSSWTFVTAPSKRPERSPLSESATIAPLTSGLPCQDSFLCAMALLAPLRDLWLRRWFPSLGASSPPEESVATPVKLCDRGLTWRHLVIDMFLPAFPIGRGLLTPRNAAGEWYAMILHKAYAKLKGSYLAIASISTIHVLRELTGEPWVCLYRDSRQRNDAPLSVDEARRRQDAVQRALSPPSAVNTSLVVVSLGEVDNHHRSFRVTALGDEEPSASSAVVLHDGHGDLRKHLHDCLEGNQLELGRDSTELRLSWEQIAALAPTVHALALGRRYERRLRQILLQSSSKPPTLAIVLSVATLSTLVFSASHVRHFESGRRAVVDGEGRQPNAGMRMSLYSVENDFSLTPMPKDDAMDSVVDCWEQGDSNDSVLSNQVVRTLSAGEYVLTITARRLDRNQAERDVVDSAALSPTTVDSNLQLVFDCLDREGRHELTKDDLASFLNLSEHVTPASPLGDQSLHDFLCRFGSSTRSDSVERSLTLDDLRDVYLSLAAEDSACRAATGAEEGPNRSWTQHRRFKELVWHDLLRLLHDGDKEEGGGRDLADDTKPTTQVDRRELVELVCCIHSDAPLLNVAALPGEKGSLVVNAT